MTDLSAQTTRTSVSNGTAIDILCDLVRTSSVSNHEVDAVCVFVRAANQIGLDAEIDEAGNGHALTRNRQESAREIVLLGHIDTVPGDIPVRVEDGVLYGRGSVDAKGPLCAMLCAAARAVLPEGISVRVVAAVGEEIAASPGAHFVATQLKPAACIIGEPSGWDGVTLGYKGTMQIRASVQRENTHTAGPEASAVDMLFAWWNTVLAYLYEINQSHERLFDQVQSTIRTSTSSNDGVVDQAEMTCGFRLPRWILPEELESAIRAHTTQDVTLDVFGHQGCWVADRNDAVARAISNSIRQHGSTPRPKHKTGTADMCVVGPVWQCPIAAYGPGDSSLDHTPNEHIRLDEYAKSIDVLATAIETLAHEIASSICQ
ncbi:MAG: [LysW]-lysine hydrolase [Phycisphaeraceae bacterium]|nr:[LysW]-lysine hydrolase [Phycisphaerales bacterium]MCB9861062.1 [LysW]-lysine hydrolase [Phycisphaeraceae bacterium]